MLAFLAAISTSFSEAASLNSATSFRPIQIHINFSVASPRSECADFPGICRMSAGFSGGGRAAVPTGVDCGGFALYDNGTFVVEYPFNEMSDELFVQFKKQKYFTVEESVMFPQTIVKSLSIPQGAQIQPGKYLIITAEDRFKVTYVVK